MELRQLTADSDRRIFAQRMEEARAKQGVGFRETRRSRIGQIHLEHGLLYGLFEHDGDSVEQMMSGFVMHDLASFPQSHPQPNLTHLPARSVLECGELWSFARGAGLLARRGATILAGLMQIQAFLVYPTLKPWDQASSYSQANFVKAGKPIVWPYCETREGGPILVQPMVLEGEPLAKLLHHVFTLGFATSDSLRRIKFDNPFALEPSLSPRQNDVDQVRTASDSSGTNGHAMDAGGPG